MIATPAIHPTHDELTWCARRCRVPQLRALRQFAEDDVVIPEGKYRGLKLRIHRQPYVGLLYDALDSGRWTRAAVTGTIQGGKSLCGWVAPAMWHLFEHRETVICGLPTMDVAGDKWREEIRPAIEASRYRELLPRTGPASRGGTGNLTAIKFTHGPTLKFMSGGGGDEKRSSFTSRVVVITEADKMDQPGQASREADPVSQLEGRMLSYEVDERRLYMECTASIVEGRIWREYQAGTASRIACPCPHCGRYVTPEREHLHGWQGAANKIEAGRLAHFCCPACGGEIDDAQRVEMNLRAQLVHRGQEISPEGQITGEVAETDTLGFRWNAFNNLFWRTAGIAAKEWTAARAQDEDESEKELLQFYWSRPWEPPAVDLSPLVADVIRRRFAPWRKGFVPAGTKYLTVGVDVGKWVGWWIAIAWLEEGTAHIVDYGTMEVPSKDQDVKLAILLALRKFRDETAMEGWALPDGAARIPEQVWIDCRYEPEAVLEFCRESGERFRPAEGCGAGQHYRRNYHHPKKTTRAIRLIGQQYHFVRDSKRQVFVVQVNADHWKSFLHDRLTTPLQDASGDPQPGAMSVYHATDENEHTSLAKHFTAEKAVEEFVPGIGTVIKWIRKSRKNHWLDAAYDACAAGHFCGFRLIGPAEAPPPARPAGDRQQVPLTTPDGRPYLVTER